jgi:hypothetical protein
MRRLHSVAMLWLVVTLILAVAPVHAAEATALTLTAQRSPGGTVLAAAVTDAGGAPVAGAAVTFKVRTTFGWLVVGETATDPAGRAAVTLPSTSRPTEAAVEVEQESGLLRATILLEKAALADPAIRPGRDVLRQLSPQPGLISPYPVPQMLFLGLIVGGVWLTYAYVVSLLVKIRWARSDNSSLDIRRTPDRLAGQGRIQF